jgi:hypothetical protein
MGYDTKFCGQFNLDKPLTLEQHNILTDFANTDHRNDFDVLGYHCDWAPTKDGIAIEWNGSEKFYDYGEWLEYLLREFLVPWGYTVNGKVTWQGAVIGEFDEADFLYLDQNILKRTLKGRIRLSPRAQQELLAILQSRQEQKTEQID